MLFRSGRKKERKKERKKVVGVDNWEEMKGKYIRIVENGLGRPINVIGNLIDDIFYDIKTLKTLKLKEVAKDGNLD